MRKNTLFTRKLLATISAVAIVCSNTTAAIYAGDNSDFDTEVEVVEEDAILEENVASLDTEDVQESSDEPEVLRSSQESADFEQIEDEQLFAHSGDAEAIILEDAINASREVLLNAVDQAKEFAVSVYRGLCVLLDGDYNIQLTPSMVTKEAVVDINTRTAYVLLDNSAGTLKGYNPDRQAGDSAVKLFNIATGVTGFTYDSNGNPTGYKTTSGTHGFLTTDEIDAILANGGNVPVSKPDTSSSKESSIPKKSSSVKPAEPEPSEPQKDDEKTTSSSSSCKTEDKKSSSSSTSKDETKSSSAIAVSDTESESLLVRDNTIYLVSIDKISGLRSEYTIATFESGSVSKMGISKDGLVYIVYKEGRLDVSYKGLSQPYTLTETGASALHFEDGYVVSVTIDNVSRTYTYSQIKELVDRGGAYVVVITDKDVNLVDGNGKTVDTFRYVKKNMRTIRYHEKKFSNVKTATFNSKGQLTILTRGGKLFVVPKTTLRRDVLAKKVRSINFSNYGIAVSAEKKNGTTVNCTDGAEIRK